MLNADNLLSRITINPKLMLGKPTIRGMRITVEQILRALSGGVSEQELLEEHPELEKEDFQAVFAYATGLVEEEQGEIMRGYPEKNKSVREFQKSIVNVDIKISKKVKSIHPIIENLTNNLSEIDVINFIKVSPDFLQASSETTEGRIKTPITEPGHPTAIGLSLIIDFVFKNVQFYEITSAIKEYGGKMVNAVFEALPNEWSGCVVMDWSNGFWDKMKEKHHNLEIM